MKPASKHDRAVLIWREIPDLNQTQTLISSSSHTNTNLIKPVCLSVNVNVCSSNYACVSMAANDKHDDVVFAPTAAQFIKYPLAIVALVPKGVSLFAAGAVAGAVAKSFTAPLDRVKILMQAHFLYYYCCICPKFNRIMQLNYEHVYYSGCGS